MKKKILSILLIGIMIIGLTGCGSKNNKQVEIMNNLIGTWVYKVDTSSDYIKEIKSTYTFEEDYKFSFKNVTIMSNGKEMTLKDLTGTFELDMENNKINLTFDDEEKSDGLIKELTYKYENGKFSLNPSDDGNDTYMKQ